MSNMHTHTHTHTHMKTLFIKTSKVIVSFEVLQSSQTPSTPCCIYEVISKSPVHHVERSQASIAVLVVCANVSVWSRWCHGHVMSDRTFGYYLVYKL